MNHEGHIGIVYCSELYHGEARCKQIATEARQKKFYSRHAVGIKSVKSHNREVAREMKIHQLYRDSGGNAPHDATEDGAGMFTLEVV